MNSETGTDRSLRVVGAIHESPVCHSEPFGEESRFAQVYFVLLEILRSAQDDKLGVVGANMFYFVRRCR